MYRSNKQTKMNVQGDKEMFEFLANAPKEFHEGERIKKFQLKNGDYIHCVLWNMHFYITGTDIVKVLVWRFQNAGRAIVSLKKFEEGVFSDLRNLKPGIDATLEGPRSEFLEFLYKNGCIRTQKKQKVFYWYSVPHDALFCDALERDLRRETNLFTYNKYMSNLARNGMMPQSNMQGFGSHTRNNSKRAGNDYDPRYLRTIEKPMTSMNTPFTQRVALKEQDMFFDQSQIKKQMPDNIIPRQPSSHLYDSQYDDMRKSSAFSHPAYNSNVPLSIKDRLFSGSEDTRQQLFGFDGTDDIFSSSPYSATKNGMSMNTSSLNGPMPMFHSDINSSYVDELPNGFSLDDFDFLRQKTDLGGIEDTKKMNFKDEREQISEPNNISMIHNSRSNPQK